VSWTHASATQVDLFRKCPEAYRLRYVAKVPEGAKSRGIVLGDAAHARTEAIREGAPMPELSPEALELDITVDEVERLARAAIAEDEARTRVKWPEVDVCPGRWENEYGFEIPTYPGGPAFVGYLDRSWWPDGGVAEGAAKPLIAVILDYKFRGDARYAPAPIDMASGVQMTSYAAAALRRQGLWDADDAIVGLGHVNVLTRGKARAWSVPAEVTALTVRSRWAAILETVREMQAARLEPELERRGAKNGHCRAFGGCPYQDLCFPKEDTMPTVAEMLAAKRAKAAEAAPAPPTHAQIDPVGAPPIQPANAAPAPALVPEMLTGAAAEAHLGEKLPLGAGVMTGRLVPPDAGPRAQAPETVNLPASAKLEELPEELRGLPKAEPPVTKGRARKATAPAATSAAPAVDQIPDPATLTRIGTVGYVLYVDCAPVKGVGYVLGEDFLADPKRLAAEAAGVVDFRLIDFGKGKGYLADAVRAKALAGVPAALVITSMHAGSDVLLDELIPGAREVVRGMRG